MHGLIETFCAYFCRYEYKSIQEIVEDAKTHVMCKTKQVDRLQR